MPVDRIRRINELLKREIAGALYTVLGNEAIDLSAVTVTGVSVSRDLHYARVSVSIRADEARRPAILGLIGRRRAEFQDIIARNVALRFTPRLDFEIDPSVERGDRMLDLLEQIERDDRAATAGQADAGPPKEGA